MYTNGSTQSTYVCQEIGHISQRALWAELKLHIYKTLPEFGISKAEKGLHYYLLVRWTTTCYLETDNILLWSYSLTGTIGCVFHNFLSIV
jgi:hypothetical protein